MKLVIQRVNMALVATIPDGKRVGEIDKGLFILVGVGQKDTKEDARVLAEKVSKLRIMADEGGKMNLNVKDTRGELLIVSQFTLYGDSSKGNRPSFVKAKEPREAEEIYEYFILCLKEKGLKVETGSFGSYMRISVELDGPVTIIITENN